MPTQTSQISGVVQAIVRLLKNGFRRIAVLFPPRRPLKRGGFVSAALRAGVPIIPCSIVGAEEIYPIVGNVTVLARLLGFPYVPVTPFFPLLGPLGLLPLPLERFRVPPEKSSPFSASIGWKPNNRGCLAD